jgi:hypothetical protein
VVILCEPVQRMQSYYYHFLAGPSALPVRDNDGHDLPFGELLKREPYQTANSSMWSGGEYANQISYLAKQLGHVAILPTVWFDADAQHSVAQLTELVRRRSGRADVLEPTNDSPRMPESNSHKHPPLEEDVARDDLVNAAQHFQKSNRRVYEEVYGERKHISLIGSPQHYRDRDQSLLAFLEPAFLPFGKASDSKNLDSALKPIKRHLNSIDAEPVSQTYTSFPNVSVDSSGWLLRPGGAVREGTDEPLADAPV